MTAAPTAGPHAGAPLPDGRDPSTQPDRLSGGALGLTSVLFCIVTGAAPLAAMLFNVPVATLGAGYASPAAFAVATVALTIFSVGYIAMCRRVTSAGGFYTFVTRGLGRVLGLGSGLLIALCYMVFTAAVTGTMGYFASTTVASLTGLELPAWVYMIVGLGLMTVFALFHIELTAKVLGVALVAEVVVLAVLAIGVFASGGAEGFSLAPLNPLAIFDNPAAVQVFGAGASGIALFAAFWSWVGFEMAPNYAEETRDPHRIARTATYGSVIGLGVLYVIISYVYVTGWGLTGATEAVQAQYAGEIASAFYPLTDRYVGAWATVLMEILIVTGSFACAMAFYNTSARYLFALGREGVLPTTLARTSHRHSPVTASITVTALVGLYCLAFVLYDPSNEGALLKLGTWSPLLGVLGILGVQALVSIAIIRYFRTTARDGFRWWSTLVAPVLGFAAMAGACTLLVVNRYDLAGASDAAFIVLLPWVVLAVFVAGLVLGLVLRSRYPDRYARIGQFEVTP
ncbi:APC family permease [Pseudonocardia cypriaca]|uniref:Amino acid/polyamine/organocation transporter (APC superfamily) n=1 Tax=Pseudonocardia cypriaca TaxID=882449 RepID=A0A543FU01_9PSEU|nr:APC family permease [Pseudonocardia cypriaca]TQM37296.1 amino acid/polyamine/organocation transporter (APC superfamily) [Pseudonocardia cypriaca]